MKFVVFLDALDYKDLTHWFKLKCVQYNPGIPKVTPNVVSQIMTGIPQEDLKFIRSTPLKKPREMDIKDKTILHYATEKGQRVLQYGFPLCSNIQLPEGSMSTYDHFQHGQQVPGVLQFAKDNVDYEEMKENPELIFHAYVDQTSVLFSTMRSIARNDNFDTIFIYYQLFDAYVHLFNQDDKLRLIRIVEEELKDLARYGEILMFSDHGGSYRDKVFYVNKWLHEKGYLHYKIYDELIEANGQVNEEFPDQLDINSPFVLIDWEKTKFYCSDVFDCMIDATDKATEEDRDKLCKELMETGNFDSVQLKKPGKEYNFNPDIMPDSSEHVACSNNIHPNAGTEGKCMENQREGWHTNRAIFGCTTELKTKVEKPTDIYDAMVEFLDKPDKELKKRIDALENKSITVLREMKAKYKNPAMLCSFGKDSMVMMDLVYAAFGEIPFPVIHLDTGYEFEEIEEYRTKMKEKYKFDLVVSKMPEEVDPSDTEAFCNYHKTENLKKILKEKGYDAVLVGIRRDEQGARGNEQYFSPRDMDGMYKVTEEDESGDSGLKSLNDSEFSGWDIYATEFPDSNHSRIHPLLHFDEKEIWEYILVHNLEICPMYYAKDGKRYRSIGCKPLTKPIDSNAKNPREIIKELKSTNSREREGRDQDKEGGMERLRALGYM